MDFPQQKKRITAYFGTAIGIYALILAFLMFYTPGLVLEEEQNGNETELFLSNDSLHSIKNITVTAGEKQVLFLPELKPGEKKIIPLEQLKGVITIRANAAFHAETARTLSLSGTRGLSYSYESSYPKTAIAGEKFTASVKICNTGKIDIQEITIEETHSQDYFSENTQEQKASIPRGQCKTLEFQLTPKQKGRTEIYFNIKALDDIKTFFNTITIEEI